MAEGVRVTATGDRRVTIAGGRRVTERAFFFALALDGAGVLGAAVSRRAQVSASLDGAGGMDAALTVRVLLAASPAGAGTLGAALSRKSYMAAVLAGIGSMGVSPVVGIPVSVALDGAGALGAAVLRRARLSAALDGAGVMAAGVPEVPRMTEDGAGRAAGGGDRILEAQNTIVVIPPPFRAYHRWGGIWTVLTPAARDAGVWKGPLPRQAARAAEGGTERVTEGGDTRLIVPAGDALIAIYANKGGTWNTVKRD